MTDALGDLSEICGTGGSSPGGWPINKSPPCAKPQHSDALADLLANPQQEPCFNCPSVPGVVGVWISDDGLVSASSTVFGPHCSQLLTKHKGLQITVVLLQCSNELGDLATLESVSGASEHPSNPVILAINNGVDDTVIAVRRLTPLTSH